MFTVNVCIPRSIPANKQGMFFGIQLNFNRSNRTLSRRFPLQDCRRKTAFFDCSTILAVELVFSIRIIQEF